jgi:leucyl aminopeptidase
MHRNRRLLAVGKGENEPQFVIMKYSLKVDGGFKTMVGKGITLRRFKHKTAGMVHMKCDMAGGAVFGAMQLIADLQSPIKVTAIVPCAENSVDSKSSFCPAM